jgi:hypothetical protein
MQPHSSSTEPTPSRIRWLKSELSRDQLHGKKVFAKFTTNQGRSFSGTGTIRALCNPEGLLSIDLVFTHILSPTEIEDIIFHISSRQLQHLTPTAASEDFDYHYDGLLKPDNTPNPLYFDVLNKQGLFFGVLGVLKKQTPYFSYKTIYQAAKKADLTIKDSTFKGYLVEAVAKGLLHDAGRAWYSGLAEPFSLDTKPVESLIQTLNKAFPLLDFTCWSTEQLQPYGHHLLTKFVSFVYTERDAMESIGERLREEGYSVAIHPLAEAAKSFSIRDQKTVVVRPLTTNQPHQKHLVLTEGILVELFLESQSLNLMDLGEYGQILKNIVGQHRIRLAQLLDYALERRPAGEVLLERINAEFFRNSALIGTNPSL